MIFKATAGDSISAILIGLIIYALDIDLWKLWITSGNEENNIELLEIISMAKRVTYS
jgi:hypothetical protein